MPVWHERTRQWVEAGRLHLVGVTQEQHPERCQLFAQWRQFDWPILHDPINVLATTAVPIFVALDEHGVVRMIGPRADRFEEDFINRTFDPPDVTADALPAPLTISTGEDIASLQQTAEEKNTAIAWRRYADGLALWQTSDIDRAIDAYTRALELSPDDGAARFRLGVCYRLRHDGTNRQPGDFQEAVDAWSAALALDPNQYIWRRRIQQYGPRLDKPYPFYDWVARAQDEIRERGEEPIALAVEPYGAELAAPSRTFIDESLDEVPPASDGRIARDTQQHVRAEVAVVPARVPAGQSVRVHVTFFPSESGAASWHNESEPLRLWVETPNGWQRHAAEQPLEIESSETRRLDFEVQIPADTQSSLRLNAYALYWTCREADGVCAYLRQDLPIEIRVSE